MSQISKSLSKRFDRLTTRELSVAEGIADGLPNSTIAGNLGISEKTVKNILLSVSTKMDISRGGSSRVRVALCAHEVGPFARSDDVSV